MLKRGGGVAEGHRKGPERKPLERSFLIMGARADSYKVAFRLFSQNRGESLSPEKPRLRPHVMPSHNRRTNSESGCRANAESQPSTLNAEGECLKAVFQSGCNEIGMTRVEAGGVQSSMMKAERLVLGMDGGWSETSASVRLIRKMSDEWSFMWEMAWPSARSERIMVPRDLSRMNFAQASSEKVKGGQSQLWKEGDQE